MPIKELALNNKRHIRIFWIIYKLFKWIFQFQLSLLLSRFDFGGGININHNAIFIVRLIAASADNNQFILVKYTHAVARPRFDFH